MDDDEDKHDDDAKSSAASTGSSSFDYREIDYDEIDYSSPEQVEAVTLQECKDVTKMVINIPASMGHPYLARDEAAISPFATELYKYCQRKQLDPRDWFFDEFGLCVTGFGLLSGMYGEYKEHKNDKKKTKKIDVGSGVDDSYSRAVEPEKEIPAARPDMGLVVGGT